MIDNPLLKIINAFVELLFNIFLIITLIISLYFIVDSQIEYIRSDSDRYLEYSPFENKKVDYSFENLKKINPEVIAWLKIEGTNIDYPVVQSINNKKYLSTDALNNYSSSGSIFIDYKNKPPFSKFITIIYGHHMSNGQMFGELGNYKDESFFKKHKTAELYYQNKKKAIEFLAFLDHVDGYDKTIYYPILETDKSKMNYLNKLLNNSCINGNTQISENDNIVLLSTCDRSYTNGRMILVGKIVPEKRNQNSINIGGDRVRNYINVIWIIIALLCILLIILLIQISKKNKRK